MNEIIIWLQPMDVIGSIQRNEGRNRRIFMFFAHEDKSLRIVHNRICFGGQCQCAHFQLLLLLLQKSTNKKEKEIIALEW